MESETTNFNYFYYKSKKLKIKLIVYYSVYIINITYIRLLLWII